MIKTNKLIFPGLAIGFEEYENEILRRSSLNSRYTYFNNFGDYFPSEVNPGIDIFAPSDWIFEMAMKFTDLLAVLKHWSGPPTSDKSRTLRSVRIYMANFLFFKWFDERFFVPGKKIQLDSKTKIVIRCDIERKNFPLLRQIEKAIGPMWKDVRTNNGEAENKSIENDLYWSEGVVPFLRIRKFTIRQIEMLKLRWNVIGQGYAPGYKVIKCNDIKLAAAELPVSHSKLRDMLEENVRTNIYSWSFGDAKRSRMTTPFLTQCGELEGRKFVICTPEKYININMCYRCQNNAGELGFAVENNCSSNGLIPLGKDIVVVQRNEIPESARRLIKIRDSKYNPICLISRVSKEKCSGKMVYCHVRSALETTYRLDERDAFYGCAFHNRKQGALPLLSFLPEAKQEAKVLGLRTTIEDDYN